MAKAERREISATAPPKSSLGGVIRARRLYMGLRLVDLASRIGLSASYLSQVEHDRIYPSIVALGRIAQGLGTSMGAIFTELDDNASPTCSVVRRSERKTVMFPNSPIRNELLVRNLQGALEVMWTDIPPGAKSPVFRHEGEECGIILSGRLHYWVGEEGFVLDAGDAISYKSNVPHRYENRTRKSVQTIWVVTPPGF